MERYLVLSFNPDEEEGFMDIVDAHHSGFADKIVYEARKTVVAFVYTAKDLRGIADRMDSFAGVPKDALELRRSIES